MPVEREGGVPGSARHDGRAGGYAGRAHVRDGITFLPRRRPGRAAQGGGRRPWPLASLPIAFRSPAATGNSWGAVANAIR